MSFIPDLANIRPFALAGSNPDEPSGGANEISSSAWVMSDATLGAAKVLDGVIGTLAKHFSEGSDYFKVLVHVFRNVVAGATGSSSEHLQLFHMIIPALTLNFVEAALLVCFWVGWWGLGGLVGRWVDVRALVRLFIFIVFAALVAPPAPRYPSSLAIIYLFILVFIVQAKDQMYKTRVGGRAGTDASNEGYYTDDGFAVGVAYLLAILEQGSAFDSLHWFISMEAKFAEDEKELQVIASLCFECSGVVVWLANASMAHYFNQYFCNMRFRMLKLVVLLQRQPKRRTKNAKVAFLVAVRVLLRSSWGNASVSVKSKR